MSRDERRVTPAWLSRENLPVVLALLLAIAVAIGPLVFVQISRSVVARAAGKTVLIYGPSLNGSPDNEQTLAQAAGYSVTVASAATWAGMTAAQFASYNAIVFGDPTCGTDPTILNTAIANQGTWAPAVTGPIVVIGTDPVFHQSRVGGQANQLTTNAITTAASGSSTGLYASLSCYYGSSPANTAVPLLSPFGTFTVEQGITGCDSDISIVTPTSPVMSGITASGLANWSCSVHEAFDAYPSSYTAIVADTDFAPAKAYIISSRAAQQPLVGGPITITENPTGNPCLKCLIRDMIQDLVGHPVDTAFGNQVESHIDMVVPGRGIPLKFVRTYDSQHASANGPLGYGWTGDLFMSLSQPGGTGPVTITQEGWAQVVFNQNGTSYTPAAPRDIAALVHNGDGTWTFQRLGQYTYTFDSSGRLTAEKDLNGYTTTLAYNPSSQLTTITDPGGRTLTLTWSGTHVSTITDANVSPSRVVTLSYDGSGNLSDVIDVKGGHTHFGYDASHRLTAMQDPKCFAAGASCNGGNGVLTHYNAAGQVDWQQDQLGRQTSFAYSGDPTSAAGGSTTITDPKGNVTVDTYQYGVRTSETRGSGTAQAATTSWVYDPTTAALLTEVDPDGHSTRSTVDSNGNVLSVTDGLGRQTSATYNSFNEPLTKTDGNQVTTTFTYDSRGNLTQASRPLTGTAQSQVVTYRYQDPNHLGDLTSMVDPDGKVWNYAYDAYGNRSQTIDPLGNRTIDQYNADSLLAASFTPKGAPAVATDLQGAGVFSAGNGFAVARRTDGTVWAQGANWSGQLGNGTNTLSSVPVEVCAPGQVAPCSQFLSGVVSVSGGSSQSVAAKSDGTVWAWGSNSSGQLGTGDTTSHSVPVQVIGLTGVTATQVLTGYQSSFALASDGTVWAWGYNADGELGNGTNTNSTTPVHVCAPGATVPCTSFLNNVKAISTDHKFVLALKNDGTVWAWGDNAFGQLGNGAITNLNKPVQVCAVGQTAPCTSFLSGITAVAAGMGHSVALTSSSTLDVWGGNNEGELGNGTSDLGAHSIPAPVSGLSGVAAIASGSRSVLAIMNDQSLRSWGHNGNGELGIGTVSVGGCACVPTVQTVLNVFQATVVSGGEQSSFAISVDGSTWSWGDDATGELGNGHATGNYATPVRFTGITTAPSAAYQTSFTHDTLGQITSVTDPLGHVTKRTFDADENLKTFQDANQSGSACTGNPAPCTQYTYDLANQLTTVTRADGTTKITDFNADGSVLDQKDGKGSVIATYGYDSQARVSTFTDGLGNVTTYSYDGAGNRLTQQDPGGNCSAVPATGCTTMTYDGDNELKTVSYSDGVTPNVTNIGYDNDGQRTGMTDGTGTSAWTYDSLHRLTGYQNGAGAVVTYDYLTPTGGYDLTNQVGHIVYPNAAGTVTQAWDAAGRLASVKDWNGKTTTFTYDANSNLTTELVPSTVNVTDTFGFNAADQLTSISDSNGTTLFSATYGRDSVGQLASDSSQPSSQSAYRYTSLDQLCYAGSTATSACTSPPAGSYPYAYDTADNLVSMENSAHTGTNTQQFNAADELCWFVAGSSNAACSRPPNHATVFSYDTRGNRTAAVPSTGSATCDTWDMADRLTSITTGTGSTCTTPTTVATYTYDGQGLRMSKTTGGATTNYTWDGQRKQQMLLQAKTGTTLTSYIYANGVPIEQVSGTTTYWLHHDQLGSTRLMTDGSGTSAATFTYDPFGNTVSSTGTASTALLYAGQFRDSESGLYYLRARYYEPATGQFLSRDPMMSRTKAPYSYVGNNPLNGADPSGLYYAPDMKCTFVGPLVPGEYVICLADGTQIDVSPGLSSGPYVPLVSSSGYQKFWYDGCSLVEDGAGKSLPFGLTGNLPNTITAYGPPSNQTYVGPAPPAPSDQCPPGTYYGLGYLTPFLEWPMCIGASTDPENNPHGVDSGPIENY